jgi:hypothetical protein
MKYKNMKIVINNDYGGFELSPKAIQLYYKLKFNQETYILERTGSYANPSFKKAIKKSPFYKIEVYTTETPNLENRDEYCSKYDFERNDPILIEVVEKLGEKANGRHANLKIVEIPDDVEWEIKEYDGIEHIAEVHKTWY